MKCLGTEYKLNWTLHGISIGVEMNGLAEIVMEKFIGKYVQ